MNRLAVLRFQTLITSQTQIIITNSSSVQIQRVNNPTVNLQQIKLKPISWKIYLYYYFTITYIFHIYMANTKWSNLFSKLSINPQERSLTNDDLSGITEKIIKIWEYLPSVQWGIYQTLSHTSYPASLSATFLHW